ncbi:hypothetical protein LZ32DRAFT_118219 [Colletotrichum eremochloae]|nr:hypothetical protein LZ32DRAFT_118219 [Colletotrichum eremochloae]
MHENIVHLSVSEDPAEIQMENGLLQYHREACIHRSKETGKHTSPKGRLLILEKPSTLLKLLFAWLTTFGILITSRNFAPTGLEEWTSQFPLCSSLPHHSRFSLHNRSCEYQIFQLVLLQILFWINILDLLWRTSFGQKHAIKVFTATTASTGLAMIFINDMASALLLAMPVILSTITTTGYVLDATR